MNLLKRTTALLIITLVLGAAGCSKSNDGAITTRVKHAISKEPALRDTKVSVATNEKVVHLSGTVKSRDERAMLIAVARKVEGVKAVKTDLVVQPQEKPKVAAARAKPKTAAEARPKQKPRAQPQRVTQRAGDFPGTGR
jgi:BON domain